MLEITEDLITLIVEKIDILKYISSFVELKQISSNEFFGICPFHEEDTASFSVTPEKKVWHCFGEGIGGSVIQFQMKKNKCNFREAVKQLLNYFEIDPEKIPKTPEILNYLKRQKRVSQKKEFTREILSPSILHKFEDITFDNSWTLDESIPLSVLKKHDVKFDRSANRIIYPIYDFCGNLINIKGRTQHKCYQELGITKYQYYYKLYTLDFLYNLNRIRENSCKDEIIIFESAKSTMKLESFNWINSASLETSTMTDAQKKLLLQSGFKNVIISLDKGIQMQKIKKNFMDIARFTNLYVMYDFDNLLKDKNSSIDQGFEIFRNMYDKRIKI